MNDKRPARTSGMRLAAIVFFLCIGSVGFMYSNGVSGAVDPGLPKVTPTPRRRAAQTRRPARYSQFPHDVKAHRVECGNCHKFPSPNWQKGRAEADAFPDITDYPQHQSCLNCHKQQFFRGAKPAICSICHTNPSPRNSQRHAFPNPREIFDATPKGKAAVSDFAITFPHDKHIDIVAGTQVQETGFVNAAWRRSSTLAEESCSVCHQTYQPQGDAADEYVTKPPADIGDRFWLKKGAFKTVPIGHKTCFTCHSADSGMTPAPTDCSTCHTLKPPAPAADFDISLAARMKISDKIMLDSWRGRSSSGTFRHEWFSHNELSCSTCHKVDAITADPATRKVSIASCSACHVTATADDGGALNFEVEARKSNPKFECVKCHIAFGKSPIPASHVTALESTK